MRAPNGRSPQQLRIAGIEPSDDELLLAEHYLGPSTRAKFTYRDDLGLIVFAAPASRRLPSTCCGQTPTESRFCAWDRATCAAFPRPNTGSRVVLATARSSRARLRSDLASRRERRGDGAEDERDRKGGLNG
jgi:hypothetical protein